MDTKKTTGKKKRIVVTVLISVVFFVFVLLPIGNGAIYEFVFMKGASDGPYPAELSKTSFLYEAVSFESANRKSLNGYLIESPDPTCRKTVILSKGMNGVLESYASLIEALNSAGFRVFSYDYFGMDRQRSLGGLPEASIDLMGAVAYIRERFPNDSISLVGHSLGAYASGAILPLVEGIDAAVLFAPFDRSSDLLQWKAERYVGFLSRVMLPYVRGYELLKFGAYSTLSVTESALVTSVPILILHGEEDEAVPPAFGIDRFRDTLASDPDVTLSLIENEDHEIGPEPAVFEVIARYLLEN